MQIAELDISKEFKKYLTQSGFTELYPPQADCVKAGLLENENMLLAIPTASGKTLAATLAMIKYFEDGGDGIAVYLTPLNALTAEKYKEFKEFESMRHIKIHVGMQAGGQAKRTTNANIRIVTNESLMASLILDAPWTRRIRFVVADEVHTIHDPTRGPDLEMALVTLMKRKPSPRILALSATVGNPKTVAKWLNAKYVSSDWRPVKLREGVLNDKIIQFNDGNNLEFNPTSNVKITTASRLAVQTVEEGGQSIIFAGTRKHSVSAALKAAEIIHVNAKQKAKLVSISKKILDTEDTTDLIEKLSQCVKFGSAFHHAGLNDRCRKIVEDEFRNRNIQIIASTPTLAAGVNMPARRIIITSYIRYGRPITNISVLEYKQMCGRAGRPKYDTIGESIIIPSPKDDPTDIYENYVRGKPENIQSKLGKRLAFHTLVCIVIGKNTQWKPGKLIQENKGMTEQEIIQFFDQTLARQQYKKNMFDQGVKNAISYLNDNDLIAREEKLYKPTEFGRIVNRNIMEPSIAIAIKNWLNVSKKDHEIERLILRMSAFVQGVKLVEEDFEESWDIVESYVSEYGVEKIYHSMLAWIQEKTLKEIESDFGMQEGYLYWYNRSIDRFLSWTTSIAEFYKSEWSADSTKLRKRINYGVKEELLDLVSVKQIGRVRARRLYTKNIKTTVKLASTKPEIISRILNQKQSKLIVQIINDAKRQS
ncbi:MAG: DEAD/DEAH box helicase [Candidatus Nitrosoabyssus spongiisocia]|nr:MAG: DEAD/DEAH box helicase [Nitrosopumilaceae archaeon AB1(1)]